MNVLRIGARKSPLAVAQAQWVAERCVANARAAGEDIEVELVGIVTTGDIDLRDLTQIGGTGVFAAAVRQKLQDGRIDVAVHSMKDLPTQGEPGLLIGAIPEREDVRDVLVGLQLDQLRDGSRVGTGSPRRAVQLQAWAALHGLELQVQPIRGNLDTRIAKVGVEVDAIVLAAAGLKRLGRLDTSGGVAHGGGPDAGAEAGWRVNEHRAQALPVELMLPAAGQGALAVEIAEGSRERLAGILAGLNHPESAATVDAERSFLATMEAGCLAPVGVSGVIMPNCAKSARSDLTLSAVIGRTIDDRTSPDVATPVLHVTKNGDSDGAVLLGRALAGEALAVLGDVR